MKGLIYALLVLGMISCQEETFEIMGTTENFTLTSVEVEDEFTIYVYLPPNYPQSNTQYPLIIGTDGDNEFENMAGIISQEINNNNIPPSIFVGIGYGSESDNDKKRNRDYTPSMTEGIEDFETGGAENFYDFIRKELIPLLETNYSIDTTNNKTLMGHSYGGLFTLFAMFQNVDTNPFNKFIPVASSFWYDSGIIFEFEEAYAQGNNDFEASIYTSMGALEGGVMIASFEELNERIKNRNYPSLMYKSELLEQYGHSRSDFISYKNGLEYVFNN